MRINRIGVLNISNQPQSLSPRMINARMSTPKQPTKLNQQQGLPPTSTWIKPNLFQETGSNTYCLKQRISLILIHKQFYLKIMTNHYSTKLTLIIIALFFFGSNAVSQWTQKGQDIYGETGYGNSGQSVSISDNGFILAVGEPNNGNLNGQTGHVRTLEWNGVNWVQMGADIDGDSDNDMFGNSVSLSANGNVLAIGAPGDENLSTSEGLVKVFLWDGNNWGQLGSTIFGSQAQDLFGYSIAISADGSRIVVGAPGTTNGEVRVYDWNGTDWLQIGTTFNGSNTNVKAGASVAISADGNVIVYGSPNDYTASGGGKINMYEWDSSNWQSLGYFFGQPGDQLGASVAFGNNDTIMVVGSPRNDLNGIDAGMVSVYVRQLDYWTLSVNLFGEAANEWFGSSVAVSDYGNMIAGANFGFNGFGYVRTFEWDGSAWETLDDITGAEGADLFGTSIALSDLGTIMASGAPQNDGIYTNAGQVRVFEIGINSVDQSELNDVVIFPNPFVNTIYVKNLPNEPVFYTIQDIIGKKIDSGIIGEMQTLDLSHLESGTYQIQLTTSKGVLSQTVIKL